jgi:hypothetical protein
MITKYIRTKKGQMKGCIVLNEEGRIGYSLCHPKDKNKNSKKLARQIAIKRIEKRNIFFGIPPEPMVDRHGITIQLGWWSRRNNQYPRFLPQVIEKYLDKYFIPSKNMAVGHKIKTRFKEKV